MKFKPCCFSEPDIHIGQNVVAAAAFTLTELLVVIAILTLLAAMQLPALTGGKGPTGFTQCMNNLRQIGQASMVYKNDNNDAFPYGNRCNGSGTGVGSVVDPYAWPMQLLHYLGNNTNQTAFYLCPNEKGASVGWVYPVHFVANRQVINDINDLPQAVTGAQIKRPSIYWMLMEKNSSDLCNIRPGGLGNPILAAWNVPPGIKDSVGTTPASLRWPATGTSNG